jgi:hypothetical protein
MDFTEVLAGIAAWVHNNPISCCGTSRTSRRSVCLVQEVARSLPAAGGSRFARRENHHGSHAHREQIMYYNHERTHLRTAEHLPPNTGWKQFRSPLGHQNFHHGRRPLSLVGSTITGRFFAAGLIASRNVRGRSRSPAAGTGGTGHMSGPIRAMPLFQHAERRGSPRRAWRRGTPPHPRTAGPGARGAVR